jgi:hypothetical protein
MKWLIALAALVAAVAVAAPIAFAGGGNPNGTGQPSQTCLSSTAPTEPGHAAGSTGSPFNEVDGTAGAMYAGSQPQNSGNPTSVSQYDVACFNVSQR